MTSGRLLSVDSVADLLAVEPSEVRRWIKKGGFPPPRVLPTGTKRWLEIDIITWLAELQPQPTTFCREPPPLFVYFIRSGECVKIGVTDNPAERLKTLQTANPESLELIRTTPGGYKLERELHARFTEHRVRPGGEWFRFCEEIQEYVRGLQ